MERIDRFVAIASAYGVTVNEAAAAAQQMAKAAKKAITDEQMAALIQQNISLTWLQKRRLIRRLQGK